MKNLLLKFALLLLLSGQLSCGEDIADCPSKMCVISGGWKLTEVFIDGIKDTEDLSKYQLILNAPTPTTNTTSDFDRIQPSGTPDNGVWSIENAGDILRLIPDNNTLLTEDWQIESFTLRKLVLLIVRPPSKDGPTEIRFVLEPF